MKSNSSFQQVKIVSRCVVLASGGQMWLGDRQWPGVVAMNSCCEAASKDVEHGR
jgi:hypothetical protein